MILDPQIIAFFSADPVVLPLFSNLAGCMMEQYPSLSIVTQRSQISFRDPRPFCYTWLPLRGKIKGRPEHYLVLSFGLDRRIDSPRMIQIVEPYPRRWMHHLLLHDSTGLDAELLGWIDLAHTYARRR